MIETLAAALAKSKMQEMGVTKYTIRLRYWVLKASEQIKINLSDEVLILISDTQNLKVVSRLGSFDLSDTKTNEQQIIHQGTVTIKNLDTALPKTAIFLHAIPINTPTP